MTMQCRSKYKSFDLIQKFECCRESSALSVNDKTCPVILLTTELTSLKKDLFMRKFDHSLFRLI